MRGFLGEILGFMALTAAIVLGVVAAGSALLPTGAPPAAAPPAPARVLGEPNCVEVAVVPVAASGVGGHARLCIVDEAVRPLIEVDGLTQDSVYTAWLGYFHRPSDCKHAPCALGDALGDDPAGVLARIDGVVADGFRKSHFASSFRDLRPSVGSELRLMIFDHGPPRARDAHALARHLFAPPIGAWGTQASGSPPASGPEVAFAIVRLTAADQ